MSFSALEAIVPGAQEENASLPSQPCTNAEGSSSHPHMPLQGREARFIAGGGHWLVVRSFSLALELPCGATWNKSLPSFT